MLHTGITGQVPSMYIVRCNVLASSPALRPFGGRGSSKMPRCRPVSPPRHAEAYHSQDSVREKSFRRVRYAAMMQDTGSVKPPAGRHGLMAPDLIQIMVRMIQQQAPLLLVLLLQVTA
ncbi:hypothetical protein V8C42DRAFT_315063 [Trichoderma barbatum]